MLAEAYAGVDQPVASEMDLADGGPDSEGLRGVLGLVEEGQHQRVLVLLQVEVLGEVAGQPVGGQTPAPGRLHPQRQGLRLRGVEQRQVLGRGCGRQAGEEGLEGGPGLGRL